MLAEKLPKIVLVLLISLLCISPGLPSPPAGAAESSPSSPESSTLCRTLEAAPPTPFLTCFNPAPAGDGAYGSGSDALEPGLLLERSAPGSGPPESLTAQFRPRLAKRSLLPSLNPLSPFPHLPRCYSRSNLASPSSGQLVSRPRTNNLRERILTQARYYLGTPYRRGSSLRTGHSTDCSGFVQYIYQQSNIDLPRSSPEQARAGMVVAHSLDFAKMQPGDLLFFSQGGRHIGHVGIYLGDGKMIHASTRRRSVIISDLRQPCHEGSFVVAKRLSEVQSPN